jgi:hypothetical protein
MQGKRDTEESPNMARGNLNYRGYQKESCGWKESSKESSVRTATLGNMGWGGDGSIYFVEDKYYALQIVEYPLSHIHSMKM